MPEIRPFARHDRDGLTTLVNRHIAAVLPGGAVPTSVLLSQMERDVREQIIDPWVVDRHTIVGIAHDRVVAAAHLKRYGTDARVSDSYNDAGVVEWFVCEPCEQGVGARVLSAALEHLRGWRVRIFYADGNLPCLGVYGIPDAWPHVEQVLAKAGFDDDGGQVEVVFVGDIRRVPDPGTAPVPGLALRRVAGSQGTAFEAWLDSEQVGAFEVEDTYGIGNSQLARWADECNHWVDPRHRRHGIGSWVFRHGCAWLRFGGKDRLLTYAIERRARGASPMEGTAAEWAAYYARFGMAPLTRTRRGWRRAPD